MIFLIDNRINKSAFLLLQGAKKKKGVAAAGI